MNTTSASYITALSPEQFVTEVRKYLVPGTDIFPRSLAAEILRRVAQEGTYGGTAEAITPFLVGVAIKRLVSNYVSEESDIDWEDQLSSGLHFNPNIVAQLT